MTNWVRVPLSKIIQPRKEKEIPSSFPDLPYIGMENVSRDIGIINSLGISARYKSSAPRVFKGDVLYGRLRPYLNKVAIAPSEAFASGEFIVMPPSEDVLGKFLQFRLLSQDFVEFAGTLDTGDRPRVSWEQISKFQIDLPPVKEQHKIIKLLEDHLSRLDAALADVKEVKVKAAQFRRSLLQSAFTENLGPGATHLMTDWNTCKLSDVVELVSGFAYKSADWQDSGVPVLKITNVRNGRVALEGCSYISKKLADESVNFQVKKGDLLITLTGEIGATGFYSQDFEARLNQRVGKIVIKNEREVDVKFVAYFLESPQAREIMWATAKGIAQANISPKEVLNLVVPLPPLEIQKKIVEILESHLSRLDISVSMADDMEKQSTALRRALFQAAFTGQLTNEVISV